MSTQNIVLGIVVLLVVVGGAYALLSTQSSSTDSMMKDDDASEEAMQKDDAMMEETGDEAMQKDDSMMEKDSSDQMMSKGSYESYSQEKLALANDGKVVLYFHADWCPICRPLDAALKSADIPSGVHILKVNYDTATELKKKYGVTYQHTFVQVDAAGKLLAKWGDAFTAADVFARVK